MRKWVTRIGAVVAAGLITAPRVLAQGCAMCYADAAAQSPRAKHMLDLAILTLLVPSVLLFAGVLIAAFRRRERDLAGNEPQELSDTRLPRTVSSHPRTLPAPDALL
jgi:integral membrane sensor domain MASE1